MLTFYRFQIYTRYPTLQEQNNLLSLTLEWPVAKKMSSCLSYDKKVWFLHLKLSNKIRGRVMSFQLYPPNNDHQTGFRVRDGGQLPIFLNGVLFPFSHCPASPFPCCNLYPTLPNLNLIGLDSSACSTLPADLLGPHPDQLLQCQR